MQYATAKLGVILVNINPAYRTHELRYVLNQAGIVLLVAATSFNPRRVACSPIGGAGAHQNPR